MKAKNPNDWRTRVLARDNFTCLECGSKGKLEAHHIKSRNLYPGLALEVDNGRTLCKECHKKVPITPGLFYWVGKGFSDDGWFYRKISRKRGRRVKNLSSVPVDSIEDRIFSGYLRLLSRFCNVDISRFLVSNN